MRCYVLVTFLLLTTAAAFATCHAVTPAGGGSGTSWSSPMTLPTSPVAGDTYYLADGSYGVYHESSSGSAGNVITLKKANATDQGQGCSPSIAAGWNLATMGSSTANFANSMWIQGNYFTLDGAANLGIKITITATNSSCPGFGSSSGIYVTDFGSGTVSHVTLNQVEIVGPGYTVNPDLCSVDGIYATGGNLKVTNFTISNSYIHDVGGMLGLWGDTVLIDRVIFARDNGLAGGAQHTEAIAATGGPNVTIRYSTFIDIVSTGVIVTVNNAVNSPATGWQMYGNLFYWTATPINSPVDNGVFSCGAGKQCGWLIFNNTIADCNWVVGGFSSKCGVDFGGAGSGSTVTVYNNHWYNSISVGPITTAGVTFTNDYNTYESTTGQPTEIHGQVGSTNFFVNVAAANFHLAADTAAGTNTNTLLPANHLDPDGVERFGTGSRGTFQFVGSGPNVVNPAETCTVADLAAMNKFGIGGIKVCHH